MITAKLAILGGVVVVALACAPAAPASASSSSEPPAARANPTISRQVIDSLPEIIRQNPSVHISPDIKPGTPIVYTDGTPVPGQSAAALAKIDSANQSWGSAYTVRLSPGS